MKFTRGIKTSLLGIVGFLLNSATTYARIRSFHHSSSSSNGTASPTLIIIVILVFVAVGVWLLISYIKNRQKKKEGLLKGKAYKALVIKWVDSPIIVNGKPLKDLRVRFKNDVGIIEEKTINDRKAEKIVDIGDFITIMAYKGEVYYKDVAYGTDEERKELVEGEVVDNGSGREYPVLEKVMGKDALRKAEDGTLTPADLRNSVVHSVVDGTNIEEEKVDKALKMGKATAKGFLLARMLIPCGMLLLFIVFGLSSGAYLFAIIAVFMLLIVVMTSWKNIKSLKEDIDDK